MREALGVCPDSHGPLSEVMREGDNFGRMMGNRRGQSIRVECEEVKSIVCVARTCGLCKHHANDQWVCIYMSGRIINPSVALL